MGLKQLQPWQKWLAGIAGLLAGWLILTPLAEIAVDGGSVIAMAFMFFLYPVVFYRMAARRREMKIRCPNCGHEGTATPTTKGSFAVEVVLWLFLFMPGFIYSVWRLSSRSFICPSCSNPYIEKFGMVYVD